MKRGMKKGLSILIISLLVFALGYGIDVEAQQTPSVAEFGNYHSGTGVNLYTGDMSYSIPLLTVPGRNGLDFPLVLSYSGGIKTNQQASMVGLGWSLNLGSISRGVNGIPDDYTRTTDSNMYWYDSAVNRVRGYEYREVSQDYQFGMAIFNLATGLAMSVATAGISEALLVPTQTVGNGLVGVYGLDYATTGPNINGAMKGAFAQGAIGGVLSLATSSLFSNDPGYYVDYRYIPIATDPTFFKLDGLMSAYSDLAGRNYINSGGQSNIFDPNTPDSFVVKSPPYTGALVYSDPSREDFDKILHPAALSGEWRPTGSNAHEDAMLFEFSREGGSNNYDIDEFTITDVGGTKYFFNIPINKQVQGSENIPGESVKYVSHSKSNKKTDSIYSRCPSGESFNYVESYLIQPYIVDWGLTRIEGINPDNYINFNYKYDSSNDWSPVYEMTTPYEDGIRNPCIENPDATLTWSESYTQFRYINAIESPTHIALFHFTDRDDARGKNSVKTKKLSRISLHKKDGSGNYDPNNALLTYYFDYDYTLMDSVPDNVNGAGRLTLKGVYQCGIGDPDNCGVSSYDIPPYTFDYNFPDTPWGLRYFDRWGHYLRDTNSYSFDEDDLFFHNSAGLPTLNNQYIAPWELSKITFPTGGYVQWDYEQDRYDRLANFYPDKFDDPAVSSFKLESMDSHYGGGWRVSKVNVCTTSENCIVTRYLYEEFLDKLNIDFSENSGINQLNIYSQSSGVANNEPGTYEIDYNRFSYSRDTGRVGSVEDQIIFGRGGTPYVGYSMVTEIIGYNGSGITNEQKMPYGYSIYEFTTAKDYPNEGKIRPPTFFKHSNGNWYGLIDVQKGTERIELSSRGVVFGPKGNKLVFVVDRMRRFNNNELYKYKTLEVTLSSEDCNLDIPSGSSSLGCAGYNLDAATVKENEANWLRIRDLGLCPELPTGYHDNKGGYESDEGWCPFIYDNNEGGLATDPILLYYPKGLTDYNWGSFYDNEAPYKPDSAFNRDFYWYKFSPSKGWCVGSGGTCDKWSTEASCETAGCNWRTMNDPNPGYCKAIVDCVDYYQDESTCKLRNGGGGQASCSWNYNLGKCQFPGNTYSSSCETYSIGSDCNARPNCVWIEFSSSDEPLGFCGGNDGRGDVYLNEPMGCSRESNSEILCRDTTNKNGVCDFYEWNIPTETKYSGLEDKEYQRGLNTLIERYDSTGTLKSKVENDYIFLDDDLNNQNRLLNLDNLFPKAAWISLLRTETTDYFSDGEISQDVEYNYNPVNGMPVSVLNENTDGSTLLTKSIYAYQSADNNFYNGLETGMGLLHMWSQVKGNEVLKDGSSRVSQAKSYWKKFLQGSGGDNVYHVYETRSCKTNSALDCAIDSRPSDTIRTFVNEYDQFGRPIEVMDSLGTITRSYYGKDSDPCKQDASNIDKYHNAYVTCTESIGGVSDGSCTDDGVCESNQRCVKRFVNGGECKLVSRRTIYKYNDNSGLIEIVDKQKLDDSNDDLKSTYFYDNVWRLKETKLPDDTGSDWTSKATYCIQGKSGGSGTCDGTSNYVASKTNMKSVLGSNTLDTTTFYDGLGRQTSSQIIGMEGGAGGDNILTSTRYNSLGLVDRASAPYYKRDSSGTVTKYRLKKVGDPDGQIKYRADIGTFSACVDKGSDYIPCGENFDTLAQCQAEEYCVQADGGDNCIPVREWERDFVDCNPVNVASCVVNSNYPDCGTLYDTETGCNSQVGCKMQYTCHSGEFSEWSNTECVAEEVEVGEGGGVWSSTEYESSPLLRPIKIIPDTFDTYTYVETQYDKASYNSRDYQVTKVKNERGYWTHTYTDNFGRIVRVIEDAGSGGQQLNTYYGYDILGNLVNITDSLGRTIVKNQYDSLRRLVHSEHQDAGTADFKYDDNSNIIMSTRNMNSEEENIHTYYDTLNRVVCIDFGAAADSTENRPYTTDTCRNQADVEVKYYYDNYTGVPAFMAVNTNRDDYPVGKLIWVDDGAGVTSFGYDQRGRVVEKNWMLGTPADTKDKYTSTYIYDKADNVVAESLWYKKNQSTPLVQVQRTNYTFDKTGRLASMETLGGTFAFDYNAPGTINSVDFPNRVTTDYNYTRRQWMESINTRKQGRPDAELFGRKLVYQPNANVQTIQTFGGTNLLAMTYDRLDRLTYVDIDSPGFDGTYKNMGDFSFTYDNVGNRLQLGNKGMVFESSYYSSSNQLKTDGDATFGYDAKGNVIAKSHVNLVLDGGFEHGWKLWNNNNKGGSMVDNGIAETKALQAPNVPDIIAYQDITLDKGREYEITAAIKGNANDRAAVVVGCSESVVNISNINIAGGGKNAELWVTSDGSFTTGSGVFAFVNKEGTSDCRVRLYGRGLGPVLIDNVQVAAVGSLVKNSEFTEGIAHWRSCGSIGGTSCLKDASSGCEDDDCIITAQRDWSTRQTLAVFSGTKYTLQYRAKQGGSETQGGVHVQYDNGDTDNSCRKTLNTAWNSYSCEIMVPSDATYATLTLITGGGNGNPNPSIYNYYDAIELIPVNEIQFPFMSETYYFDAANRMIQYLKQTGSAVDRTSYTYDYQGNRVQKHWKSHGGSEGSITYVYGTGGVVLEQGKESSGGPLIPDYVTWSQQDNEFFKVAESGGSEYATRDPRAFIVLPRSQGGTAPYTATFMVLVNTREAKLLSYDITVEKKQDIVQRKGIFGGLGRVVGYAIQAAAEQFNQIETPVSPEPQLPEGIRAFTHTELINESGAYDVTLTGYDVDGQERKDTVTVVVE